MQNICISCVKHSQLKKLINQRNKLGKCSLCAENNLIIEYENSDFIDLSIAIARFNFSEWEYNRHLGGDGFYYLFCGEDNIFFHETRSISEDAYNKLVLSITENDPYPDYDEGISIYAGYTDGFQNKPLEALKDETDSRLLDVLDRLKYENYFNLEKQILDILDEFTPVAEKKIETGQEFYRSRVGISDHKLFYDLSASVGYHYSPYQDDQISAPPPRMVGAGRINRPGVSFLYCASDKYTAISEVRPHPGDKVSVGKFKLKSPANVFDLTESQLIHYSSSDKKIDEYLAFNTLSNFMHQTVTPSDQSHYSITQLIADCARQVGYDGIQFLSTVGKGHNFVFFDPGILVLHPSRNDIFLK